MAFKTIKGVVTKTRNKETGWRRTSDKSNAHHGEGSKIVVAELIKDPYAGAKQLMKYKSAFKFPHKYVTKRFATKEDIARVVDNAKY